MDYEQSWHELESNSNPFAIITMAHLKTKATTSDLTQREECPLAFNSRTL
ncbi:hypothetical protein [Scytonema sp. UIC 10036]|nr:hypothetical protein [Scytonema sp. UIC 10036]